MKAAALGAGRATTSTVAARFIGLLVMTGCIHGGGLRHVMRPQPASPPRMPSLDQAVDGRRGPERTAHAERRGLAVALDTTVMPLFPRAHPRLHSRARGSASIGTVTEGFVSEPAVVPLRGDFHEVVARVAPRNTNFTTDEMKGLLLCAAEHVGRAHKGHRLGLGNLSRMSGGDLPWSVSHNSGRDADIAFYARSTAGAIVHPDFLYAFGRDLVAETTTEPMVFDVAANWSLVKALIQCEASAKVGGAHIDYLFAATWLQHAMLRYAAASHEDSALIARARRILHQPRRAAAHADHLHLRIGCPSDDRHEGCVDKSRAPLSAIGQTAAVRARLAKLRRALSAEKPSQRAGAATLLGLYRDNGALPALRLAIGDDDPSVRRAAATALLEIDAGGSADVIEAAVAVEHDAVVARSMMRELLEAGQTSALIRALADPRELGGGTTISTSQAPSSPAAFDVEAVALGPAPLTVRQFAATLLGDSRELAPLRPLLALLRDASAPVQLAARRALEQLTNRATSDLALLAGDRQDDAAVWFRFVATLPQLSDQDELVLQGFVARGLEIAAVGRAEVGRLTTALAWPEPYAQNAARLLGRALRYQPEDGRGARAAPVAFWLPWLERRSLVDLDTIARTRAMSDGLAFHQPPTDAPLAEMTQP